MRQSFLTDNYVQVFKSYSIFVIISLPELILYLSFFSHTSLTSPPRCWLLYSYQIHVINNFIFFTFRAHMSSQSASVLTGFTVTTFLRLFPIFQNSKLKMNQHGHWPLVNLYPYIMRSQLVSSLHWLLCLWGNQNCMAIWSTCIFSRCLISKLKAKDELTLQSQLVSSLHWLLCLWGKFLQNCKRKKEITANNCKSRPSLFVQPTFL